MESALRQARLIGEEAAQTRRIVKHKAAGVLLMGRFQKDPHNFFV